LNNKQDKHLTYTGPISYNTTSKDLKVDSYSKSESDNKYALASTVSGSGFISSIDLSNAMTTAFSSFDNPIKCFTLTASGLITASGGLTSLGLINANVGLNFSGDLFSISGNNTVSCTTLGVSLVSNNNKCIVDTTGTTITGPFKSNGSITGLNGMGISNGSNSGLTVGTSETSITGSLTSSGLITASSGLISSNLVTAGGGLTSSGVVNANFGLNCSGDLSSISGNNKVSCNIVGGQSSFW
jgi:hypothetical protein